jgi:hypothetical protein
VEKLEGGYTIGHYVEGIRVGVLTSVRLFVWAAIVFFRFLSRPSVTLPGIIIISGFIQSDYI